MEKELQNWLKEKLSHLHKSDYEGTKCYVAHIWQDDKNDYVILPIDNFFSEWRGFGFEVIREASLVKYVPRDWQIQVHTEKTDIGGLVNDLLLENKPIHDKLKEIGWLI